MAQDLKLNDLEYFERQGVNVLVFSNSFKVDGNRKIQGNMILTLEDEQGQPMSFDDLAELKAIVTSLGATVGGVFYDEFPDDDSRYDSQV